MANVALMGWDAAAKVWRKVLVNAAGKLIIDPSEIFENVPTDNEHGKAPDSDWAYHQGGTKHWSCPGINFSGYQPATDNILRSGDGQVTCYADNIYLLASVNLPQGAVINSCKVYGNAGASNTLWVLTRAILLTGVSEVMASALINLCDTSISNATVDNITYAYTLYTELLYTGDIIYGASISYTI